MSQETAAASTSHHCSADTDRVSTPDGAVALSEVEANPSNAECHMRKLLERLPAMRQLQERLRAHRESVMICAQYEAVDDLACAIEILEARDPVNTPEGPRLHAILLGEKRASLAREQARLDHDLATSRFKSIVEAKRAHLSNSEFNELSKKLRDYRNDYAYTLSLCQAEMGDSRCL